jgi:hypothetical protein
VKSIVRALVLISAPFLAAQEETPWESYQNKAAYITIGSATLFDNLGRNAAIVGAPSFGIGGYLQRKRVQGDLAFDIQPYNRNFTIAPKATLFGQVTGTPGEGLFVGATLGGSFTRSEYLFVSRYYGTRVAFTLWHSSAVIGPAIKWQFTPRQFIQADATLPFVGPSNWNALFLTVKLGLQF